MAKDVRWEMVIFWIAFLLFFIYAVGSAHFLNSDTIAIVQFLGIVFILIGMTKTVLK
jgi:hypothetical protein